MKAGSHLLHVSANSVGSLSPAVWQHIPQGTDAARAFAAEEKQRRAAEEAKRRSNGRNDAAREREKDDGGGIKGLDSGGGGGGSGRSPPPPPPPPSLVARLGSFAASFESPSLPDGLARRASLSKQVVTLSTETRVGNAVLKLCEDEAVRRAMYEAMHRAGDGNLVVLSQLVLARDEVSRRLGQNRKRNKGLKNEGWKEGR